MSHSATWPSSPDGGKDAGAGNWVFAYGSLMWNWPWPCGQRRLARLDGYRRAPCLASVVYRGTPQAPGVGLGLVRGEHCVGIAFRVDDGDWAAVSREIEERELVTGVYERVVLPVRLLGSADARTSAVVYLARPDHPQFLSDPADEELVRRIAFAQGTAGPCIDYWQETLSAMSAFGIAEPAVARLVAMAGARAAAASAYPPAIS